MARKREFNDILNIVTGKDSIKVEPTPETLKTIKNSTIILGGALIFLGIAIVTGKK